MSSGHNKRVTLVRDHRILATPAIALRLAAPVSIITGWYDVPYLAGYSKDAKRIYIDRRVPPVLNVGGRPFRVYPCLVRHETVEKALMDIMGYSYPSAHEIATQAEHALVIKMRTDPHDYETALAPLISQTEAEKFPNLPPDLDMKPYAH